MKKTKVISGDISKVEADALITAINSGGMWFGGIDGVIMRAAGNHFHQQASNAIPLSHEQTIVAHGNGGGTAFGNVIFVVDDLQGKLSSIVYNGLKAASDAGFKTVSLPTIRMGVMLGAVEKSVEEAVSEMALGVKSFQNEGGDLDITFVVYNDPATEQKLSKALQN